MSMQKHKTKLMREEEVGTDTIRKLQNCLCLPQHTDAMGKNDFQCL
jgi:hypothetical protein